MTFLAVDGEYLDRVLDLTVSQPSSSVLLSFLDDNDDVVGVEETLFKSSTDRGVFKPLTVSAHDLLELDELIEDVEPKGNEQLLFEVGAASGSLGLVLEVTLEVVVRPLPGIDGMVTDLDKGRWLLTFELFCWTLAANRVCLWTKDTRSFFTLAIIFEFEDELSEEELLVMITSLFSLLAAAFLLDNDISDDDEDDVAFEEVDVKDDEAFLVAFLPEFTNGAVDGLLEAMLLEEADDVLEVVVALLAEADFCIDALVTAE